MEPADGEPEGDSAFAPAKADFAASDVPRAYLRRAPCGSLLKCMSREECGGHSIMRHFLLDILTNKKAGELSHNSPAGVRTPGRLSGAGHSHHQRIALQLVLMAGTRLRSVCVCRDGTAGIRLVAEC